MNKSTLKDQNFDQLVSRFERKVYGGLKGDIRLAVLKKDLFEYCRPDLFSDEGEKICILDAGGGYGPFSMPLAAKGHRVVICDISEKMLEKAAERSAVQNVKERVTLLHTSIQEIGRDHENSYDLILCHAVLEWTIAPVEILRHLTACLKPGGILSVIFYNLNGIILKNMLRANYNKIQKKEYAGWPGSLTPSNPLKPEQVRAWIEALGLRILCRSGMRVFHDYILNLDAQKKDPQSLMDIELQFSREMPFRDLGRYQHLVAARRIISSC